MAEVDLEALRDAVAARIATVSGLNVYPYIGGQVQTPAAGILTGEPYIDRETAQGVHTIQLRVALLVSSSNLEEAQRQLDRLVDDVVPALLTEPDPVDVIGDLWVPTVGGSDFVKLGGVELIALPIDLRCHLRRALT